VPEVIDETNSNENIGETVIPNASLAGVLATAFNYNFERAIADLVDNSIAAGAENVWVFIEPKGGPSSSSKAFIAVVDDGSGMSRERLIEAMRYGAPSLEEANNLGRFGLGMKTASSSISDVISVATRESSDDEYNRRSWDIPWLEANGEWKLLVPTSDMFPDYIMNKIKHSSGTVVLLPDLSPIKYNINDELKEDQEHVLRPMSSNCIDYLGKVFHRFISGTTLSEEYHGKSVKIWLDGFEIPSWDPFQTSNHEHHTEFNMAETDVRRLVHYHTESGTGSVNNPISLKIAPDNNKMDFRLHILPKLRPTDPLYDPVGGGGWKPSQGVYFYRLDRMIQFGGWCGSHFQQNNSATLLARLSIDVDREWDQIIKLSATKSRIIVPQTTGDTFRNDFKTIFAKLRTAAANVYNGPYPDEDDEGGDEGGDEDGDEDGDEGGDEGGPIEPRPTRPARRRRLNDYTLEQLRGACENDEEMSTLSRLEIRARGNR